MKKIIFITTIAWLLTSCKLYKMLGEDLTTQKTEWYVKNNTAQYLLITTRIYGEYEGYTISPGDSIKFCVDEHLVASGDPGFECFYGKWRSVPEPDRNVIVKSSWTGNQRTWMYSEKSEPGKQFFNESSWARYKEKEASDSPYYEYQWVFEIASEDLLPSP